MPILSHSDLSQDDLNTDIRAEDTIDITPDNSDFSSISGEISDAFEVGNTIVSPFMDETIGIDNTPEDGFDIFSEIEGTEFEPYAEAFSNVFNSKMLEATKIKVMREAKARERLSKGGLSAMGWEFVAGMLGPENLIPGGLAVKGVKQGYSVGKSAGNVAVAGGISTALAEGVLQSSQELRTTEESLLNIAAGTTLSGFFGGGLAYMANRGIKGRYASVLEEAAGFDPTFRARLDKATPEQQADLLAEANDIIIKAKTEEIDRMAKLSEEFKARVDGVDDIAAKLDELYAETRAYSGAGDLGTSDLGAAKTAKTLDELTLRGTAARAYTGASKYLHPYTRMMTQPSPWAREMAANLFENNLILRMHETEALNSAVETNVKRWADARLASALEDIGFDGKAGIYREMRQAGINMPLDEFRVQVSKALRRNDGNAVDSDGNDLGIPTGQFNPYIMKAAKKVRDDVLEKGREELNKIGRTLESKKSKTAASYLTRVWNRKKLKEKEAEFKDRNGPVWKYLETALNASIDKAAKRLETRIKNLQSEINELEDAARRRDSEYKERTGVSIRELEELDQINKRLAEVEDELANGPQIDPQAAEAFGQDFLESFNRMLPPQLRLDVVDKITAAGGDVYNQNGVLKTDTPEFKNWFGDSKGVDDEGKPRSFFHATPEGGFDKFHQDQFFSPSKEYASKYLSDIWNGEGSKPELFEVYLKTENPFDTRIPEHAEILKNEFSGKYGEGNLTEKGLPDWVEGRDIAEFLREKFPNKKFDAVIVDEGKDAAGQRPEAYIVFEPTQIKSVNNRGTFDPNDPRILYQIPGLHSSTVKAIEGMPQSKGSGTQVWNTIKKLPGIKQEELEWMDLENWLKDQKKVTQEEVLEYVNAHKIDMEETTRGGLDDVKLTEEDQAIFDKELKSAIESAEQLPPLHTDQKGISDAEVTGIRRNVMENIIRQDMDKYELAEFADYTAPGVIHENKYNEIAFSIPNTKKGSFEGMHFGPTNTFAHARVTSRKTATGKNVLHIEEVQSDLHQKGKSEGYLGEADIATQENLRERVRLQREQANIVRDRITKQYDAPEYQELQAVIHRALGGGIGSKTDPESIIKLISDLKEDGSFGTHYSSSFIDKFKTTKPELHERLLGFAPYDEVKRLQELLKNQELRLSEIQADLRRAEYGTPDLPFKGARWQELVMKRMIAKAIDEGYDGITINKGIDIARASGGQIEHFVEGEALGFKIDRSLKDPSLKIEAAGKRSHTKAQLSFREVKQYFGADIAEKVKAGIEGTDEFIYSSVPKSVEVPNGGFRTSYDGALPRFINKYVKKWGAKLEQAKVLEDGSSNPYLEFTPEMKKSIQANGQLFQKPGEATNAQGSFNPKENLIQIVKNAVDPQGSGQHELIHGLRSLKLLQDDEWALLEQSAKELDWKGKHNIEERYKDTYLDRPAQREKLILEEAVAEEFAKWRQGQLEVTPEVQTIFEKILSFLQKITDSLRARGIESYEDVFELIESGDIAARGKQQLINEAEQLGGRKQQLEAQAQHAQQNELEPGLLPEDVTNALKILNDREKPKRPQTLRQFIVNEGGLLEQDGELKYRGWTNKTHPNLVKDVYIRDQVDAFGAGKRSNKKDGYTLDDMTAKAWEEGFFDERPSVSDMLDALSDDMSGEFHVRGEDENALSLFQDRMALEEELDRLGINPAKQRHLLHTGDGERDLIAAVGRVMNSQDSKKITKLRKKMDDAEFKRMSIPEKNDLDEVDEIVRSVFNKLMGDNVNDEFFNENVVDFGFLKGKTFGIRDELVEQYLENDIEAILRSYVRNISGQVEMQKRFGSMDLGPHLSKIADEFEGERFKILKNEKLNDQQKQKEIETLWKQKADVERSLKFVRDKILGRYVHDVDANLWTRTLDGAMQVQYMMALGGVTMSSLADVWRVPMTQGMGRFYGKALPQLIAGNKGVQINRKLAKKWAGIAEITNNSRLSHLIGLSDPYIQQSPAEVAISKMTSRFSKLTGMPYWNQFWKEFSGNVIIDRALDNLTKGIDNISAKERRWLNEAGFGGLSSHMPALRSAGAVEKIQGVWTINPDKFPPQLVDQFWGGVKKEIDRTIITPGFGDLPIRMHHPLGKAAMQFKSFGFAADQKMLMRGMQDDMANTLAGVMGMTTVGMFIYMLKALESGREIDDNPMTWLTEGLDRSGAFFVFFEANNMFEKMGGPGVYYGVGARAPASRFATRNTVAGLAGPLFGSATDTAQLIGSGLSLLHPGREADATPGDIAAIRRLTPYASLPAWRWAIDNYLVPELKEEVK